MMVLKIELHQTFILSRNSCIWKCCDKHHSCYWGNAGVKIEKGILWNLWTHLSGQKSAEQNKSLNLQILFPMDQQICSMAVASCQYLIIIATVSHC